MHYFSNKRFMHQGRSPITLECGTTRASDRASLRSLGEALLIRILADQKSTERKVLTYADPWGGGLITRS